MRNTIFVILNSLFFCLSLSAQSPISNSALSSGGTRHSVSVCSPAYPQTGFTTTFKSPSAGGYSVGSGSMDYMRSGSRMSSTVASPFSNTPPSYSIRRSGGSDDDDDDDWGGSGSGTGGNAGDPEQHQFSPVGSEWCLLLMALLMALAIKARRKRKQS